MIDWGAVLVGFLLGVLGTGAGAVLEQRIIGDRRREGLVRALRAELAENIERIGDPSKGTAPGRVQRTAWDAARELTFDPKTFELLARAYAAGEDLSSRIYVVERHLSAGIAIDRGSDAFRQVKAHQDGLVDASHRSAKVAREAFITARDALGR